MIGHRPRRHAGRRKRAWALAAVALLALMGGAALVAHQAGRWQHARQLDSVTSPDGRWRIDGLSLVGDGTSALRLRVQSLPDDGSAPAVVSGMFVHGDFRPGWTCDAMGCSEFWWSADEQNRIALPPGMLARLRGLVLHRLGL